MSWISVKDQLPESNEVEIAFWDGVLMCRTFGAYTENDWYCGSEKIETCGWKVTHWKEPTSLPDPPEQES